MAGAALLAIAAIAATPAVRGMAMARRRRAYAGPKVSLPPGFYQRLGPSGDKDGVRPNRAARIHYVGHGGGISRHGSFPKSDKVRQVPAPGALRAAALLWPSHESSLPHAIDTSAAERESRVNLAAASWSFEQAALSLLSDGPPSRRDFRAACDLLFAGIQHDLWYRDQMAKTRKRGSVSYRLYDLLAGISVRYREPVILDELVRTIEHSDRALVLQSRIDKWQDVNGTWRKKWRNRRVKLTWQSCSGAVVF
jgi:hypothetical protein